MIRKISGIALGALLISASPIATAATLPGRPDLSGLWRFDVPTGRAVTLGAMTLKADGAGYRGKLMTDQGDNVLDIRSLTLSGSEMTMLVDSPNGNVVFRGTLRNGGRSFEGTVTYHNQQKFPMSGIKQ